VFRLVAGVGGPVGAGHLQAQLDFAGWSEHGGEQGFGGHSIGSAIVGGGFHVGAGLQIVADVGALRYFDRGDGNSDTSLVVANVGVRGPVTFDPRGSGALRASLQAGDGYVTIAVGLELRADFAP
jgi:hypothetical protein